MNYEKMWHDVKTFIEKQLALFADDSDNETKKNYSDEAKFLLMYMNACEAAGEE